jgi:hypothetical protein
MPKNILPPSTLTVFPLNNIQKDKSAITEVYESTTIDDAVGEWLSNLSVDVGVPRPIILMSNDDQWRAIVRALAFSKRHIRETVRRVMELILAPRISKVTVLDRAYTPSIRIDQLVVITVGDAANVAGGPYIVTGVTANELIFAAPTPFPTPSDSGVGYSVGQGPIPPPLVGPLLGTQGQIYTAADGTGRLRDLSVSFINIQQGDLLTKLNSSFPQYGRVVFDDQSPIREERKMTFYGKNVTGLMKLKDTGSGVPDEGALAFAHYKYRVIQSSLLRDFTPPGSLSLTVQVGANFPANAGPVAALLAGDTFNILEGPNAGAYNVAPGPGAVSGNTVTLTTLGPLAVTGPTAENRYKSTPTVGVLPPGSGSKGTIAGKGGIISTLALSAVFMDTDTDFGELVDPTNPASDRYSVLINRGEVNEEVVEIESLVVNSLNITRSEADPSGNTSTLRYPHWPMETVEVAYLSPSANSTYFITSTVTGVSTTTDLVDGTANFPTQLLNLTSDVEFLTGANAGQRRTITAVPLVTRIQWLPPISDPLPFNVAIGDTYRIIKRYAATAILPTVVVDDILYLDDTRGFPAADFTVIVDRGTEHEERIFISANDITTTPNTLTVSPLNTGSPSAVSQNHGSSFVVEPAQVLIEGCDWDIIETRATGEYTIAASPLCTPPVSLEDSMFLHAAIDLTKIAGVGPPKTYEEALLTATADNGTSELTINLEGVGNSYATALENPGDIGGVLCRSIKIDPGGANEEEAFAFGQKYYTTVAQDYTFFPLPAPLDPLKLYVDNADIFTYIVLAGVEITISRSDRYNPFSVAETVTAIGVNSDALGGYLELHPATPISSEHYTGDPVELRFVVVQLSDVLSKAPAPPGFPIGIVIRLLYIEDTIDSVPLNNIPRYRWDDPYDPLVTYTDLPKATLIAGTNLGASWLQSYLPVNNFVLPLQPKKSVFPGSYVYSVPSKLSTGPVAEDEVSSYLTMLGSAPDAGDFTAFYKIPITQQIIGSKSGAGPITLGQDITNLTTEILIADASQYPDTIQNPFSISLDRNDPQEEIINCVGIYAPAPGDYAPATIDGDDAAVVVAQYPDGFGDTTAQAIIVDATQVINFTHFSKTFSDSSFPKFQTYPIATSDLIIKKLVLSAATPNLGTHGGIYIDYGFTHNSKTYYPVAITGRVATGASTTTNVIDTGAAPLVDFSNDYADSAALVGGIVGITAGAAANIGQSRRISSVGGPTSVFTSAFPAATAGDTFSIFAMVEVDDSEPFTNLGQVGGILRDVPLIGTAVHPAREGGISSEYTKFIARNTTGSGNILTLAQPTVFNNAHPASTQVIVGANMVGPYTDGSSFAPYLTTTFLKALFNEYLTNFTDLIRAAGIEVKEEEKDA